MINDVNVWTQGWWIQRSGGPGHPGVAAEQTEKRRRKFTHLPTQLPPSHALWQPSQHRRLPPPRHRWASVQIVDRWCVCNSSNTLPALEKLASNVPSAWPSSFSVASRWFPLVGVHVAGRFCNIFRHDEVIKPQQDDLWLLLAKEIIPVWHEGVVTPFLHTFLGL